MATAGIMSSLDAPGGRSSMSCSFLYFFRLAAYSDSLLGSHTFSPGKEDVGLVDMQKHSHLAWKSPLWAASWWMRAEGQVGWAPAGQHTTAHCLTYQQAADAQLTALTS